MSLFCTTSDSKRKLIWRELRTRFHPSNMMKTDRYAGPGVLVWGCIMLNGRTELHVFGRGSVTRDRYCKVLILPHVRLFRGEIGVDFFFKHDNVQPLLLLTPVVQELLEIEDITSVDWPAYFFYLNVIKHV